MRTMKPLLTTLLLLICLTGRGQYIDSTDSIYVGDRITHMKPFITANIPMTPRDLVTLWDEYSQECWNDSTFSNWKMIFGKTIDTNPDDDIDVSYMSYDIYPPKHPKMDINYSIVTTIRTVYTHRDPTLEGFIEFIRKKYGI
jgi:hypothetical protein